MLHSKTTSNSTYLLVRVPLENLIMLIEPGFTYPSTMHFPSIFAEIVFLIVVSTFEPTRMNGITTLVVKTVFEYNSSSTEGDDDDEDFFCIIDDDDDEDDDDDDDII